MPDLLTAGWRRLRAALRPRPSYVYMGGYGVALTWRGDRVLLPAGDVGLPPYLATRGLWEPALERWLGRLIRPGDTVVDGGANVGYHTLAMAHAVGPRGRVHAFEPNPRLGVLLARTVEMSGLGGRIVLHQAALADRAGEASFSVDPTWSAGGHLRWEGTGPAYSEMTRVVLAHLDGALAEAPSLDLLRMDLEGAEGLALAGAEALVARSPRLRIVTEWDVGALRTRSDVPSLVERLAGWGFRARIIAPRGGRLEPVAMDALPTLELGRTVNLLLTRG